MGFWENIKGTPALVFASDWTPCPLLQTLAGGRVLAPRVPVSGPVTCQAPDTGRVHLQDLFISALWGAPSWRLLSGEAGIPAGLGHQCW